MKQVKPGKKMFYILLGSLAAILLAYGLLRSKYRPFLPPSIDKNLPDVIMFAAVGVMLWNRKILNDEKKAAAARLQAEREAAEARQVAPEDDTEDGTKDRSDDGAVGGAEAGGDAEHGGKSGTDAAG